MGLGVGLGSGAGGAGGSGRRGWGPAWPRVTHEGPGDRGGHGEATRTGMGMSPAPGCHLLGVQPRGVCGEKGLGWPWGHRLWDGVDSPYPSTGGSQGTWDPLCTPKAPAWAQHSGHLPGTGWLRGQGDTGTLLPGGLSWLGQSSGAVTPTSGQGTSGGGGGAQLAGAGRVGVDRGWGPVTVGTVSPRGEQGLGGG